MQDQSLGMVCMLLIGENGKRQKVKFIKSTGHCQATCQVLPLNIFLKWLEARTTQTQLVRDIG